MHRQPLLPIATRLTFINSDVTAGPRFPPNNSQAHQCKPVADLLLKSEAAVLLHRRLLNCVHLALEVCEFRCFSAVAIVCQNDGPEQDDAHCRFDGVILAGLVLLPCGNGCPL